MHDCVSMSVGMSACVRKYVRATVLYFGWPRVLVRMTKRAVLYKSVNLCACMHVCVNMCMCVRACMRLDMGICVRLCV